MLAYVVRRLLLAVLTVWAISVLSFVIIHLPPGDYVTSYIASMSASGSAVSEGEANALREQLGLDKNNMGNVPERQVNAQHARTPHTSMPITFYFK